MWAINKDNLSTLAGIVEIALMPITAITVKDDMSDASSAITSMDALTYNRLASITDLKLSLNTSEKKVEQKADDTGTIYSAYTPGVKVTFNWFESGNLDAIKKMLWINVLDVTEGADPVTNPASKITGMNIKPHELPQLIIRITGMKDSKGHKEMHYIYDAWMSGDLLRTFVDVTRAKEVPGSSLEFMANDGGFWLEKTERLGV